MYQLRNKMNFCCDLNPFQLFFKYVNQFDSWEPCGTATVA